MHPSAEAWHAGQAGQQHELQAVRHAKRGHNRLERVLLAPEARRAGQAGQQRGLQGVVQRVPRQQRRRQVLAQARHAGPASRAPRPPRGAPKVRNGAAWPRRQGYQGVSAPERRSLLCLLRAAGISCSLALRRCLDLVCAAVVVAAACVRAGLES